MRAAIYGRVSTDKQEKEHTIGSQLEALRAYAAKNQMEIVGEFAVRATAELDWTVRGWIECATQPNVVGSMFYWPTAPTALRESLCSRL